MINMTNYQTFIKDRLFIKLESGEQEDVPDYVDKARRRYRFDSEESILEKQCCKCGRWLKVARHEKTDWTDIHQESEIHRMRSGYSSYCCECTVKLKPASTIHSVEQKAEVQDKCSVFLSEKQRRYLKIRAAAQDKAMKELLSEILEYEMRENPIEKFI